MPSLVHYTVQGAAARIVLDSPHNKTRCRPPWCINSSRD